MQNSGMTSENLKIGLKIWFKSVVAIFMCLIMSASLYMLCSFIFTTQVGYTVYTVNEEGDGFEELYDYYYDEDEVDLRYAEYIEQGKDVKKMSIRDQLSTAETVVVAVIIQLFSLLIVFTLLYIDMWRLGDSDRNKVNFDRISKDKIRGFRLGLLSVIPSALLYVGLVLCKLNVIPDVYYNLYRFLNTHIFAILTLILGAQPTLDNTAWWQMLLVLPTLLVVPLCTQIGYTLGNKGIIIKEKILYRSNSNG